MQQGVDRRFARDARVVHAGLLASHYLIISTYVGCSCLVLLTVGNDLKTSVITSTRRHVLGGQWT